MSQRRDDGSAALSPQDAEKDALLLEQAALIERLVARVAEQEALLKPKKTSANTHIPPSQDGPGREARKAKRRRKPGRGRPALVSPGCATR